MNKKYIIRPLFISQYKKNKLKNEFKFKELRKVYTSYGFLTFKEHFMVVETTKKSFILPLNNLSKEGLNRLLEIFKNNKIEVLDKKDILKKLYNRYTL